MESIFVAILIPIAIVLYCFDYPKRPQMSFLHAAFYGFCFGTSGGFFVGFAWAFVYGGNLRQSFKIAPLIEGWRKPS